MENDERRAGRTRIAFLGLGRMGVPMATNLAKAGYALTVWNRTKAKAEPLADWGAAIAADAAGAASSADVVITMLQTDAAVKSVLFDQGVADAVASGTAVVDMSSIPPRSAITYADELGKRGVSWLDAPVSGGTRGAAAGTLTIMVGGSLNTFARCAPVLEAMGRVTYVGPPGAGQAAKIANQIIVATTIGGVAEALLFTIAEGLDPEIIRDALIGGFADSRILKEQGRRMVDRDFVPGGSVELQLKDLNIAVAEAGELDLRLPLTERVTSMFQSMADLGNGDVDHSALILELERMNNAQSGAESSMDGVKG
ncbi:MAG: NAD(P)-dependent oxidoreductase [Acidimicrobiia bacterium]|nr:MAG: NAD(P)-dependent oxidoreductase [Acidimicrobiia bacterium]